MLYTGLDRRTMEPVFVPKTPHDKALQRALMQWRKPQNRKLVLEALRKTGREDLIGYGKHCLVKPDKGEHPPQPARRADSSSIGDKGRKKPRADTRTRVEKTDSPAKPVRKKGWAKPKKKK